MTKAMRGVRSATAGLADHTAQRQSAVGAGGISKDLPIELPSLDELAEPVARARPRAGQHRDASVADGTGVTRGSRWGTKLSALFLHPRTARIGMIFSVIGTLVALGVSFHGNGPAAAGGSSGRDGMRPSASAAPSGASTAGAEEAIRFLRSKGANLLPLPDLDGMKQFLVIHDGVVPQPVIISPSGRYIVMGMASDLEGRPVTMTEVAQLIAKQGHSQAPEAPAASVSSAPAASAPSAPAATPSGSLSPSPLETVAPALMKRIESGNWIPFGRSGVPVLYAVADPSCPWCQKTWPMLTPLVDAGKIQVRLLMVGLVDKKTSFAKAVSIMMADRPQQAWADDMAGTAPPPVTIYRLDNADEIAQRAEAEAKKTGEAKAKIRATMEAEAAILTNHDLLVSQAGAGVQRTPTLFFRTAGDNAPMRYDGEPDNATLNAILAKMGVP